MARRPPPALGRVRFDAGKTIWLVVLVLERLGLVRAVTAWHRAPRC